MEWRRSPHRINFPLGYLLTILLVLGVSVWGHFLSLGIGPAYRFDMIGIEGAMISVGLLGILLFRTASAAGPFVQDRRSGAAEWLATTPLETASMVRGELGGITQQLAGVSCAFLASVAVLAAWLVESAGGRSGAVAAGSDVFLPALRWLVGNEPGSPFPVALFGSVCGAALLVPLTMAALVWNGLWLGLRMRSPALLPLVNLAVVLGLPLFLLTAVKLLGAAVAGVTGQSLNVEEIPGLVYPVALLFTNLWLVTLCRRSVYSGYRRSSADLPRLSDLWRQGLRRWF